MLKSILLKNKGIFMKTTLIYKKLLLVFVSLIIVFGCTNNSELENISKLNPIFQDFSKNYIACKADTIYAVDSENTMKILFCTRGENDSNDSFKAEYLDEFDDILSTENELSKKSKEYKSIVRLKEYIDNGIIFPDYYSRAAIFNSFLSFSNFKDYEKFLQYLESNKTDNNKFDKFVKEVLDNKYVPCMFNQYSIYCYKYNNKNRNDELKVFNCPLMFESTGFLNSGTKPIYDSMEKCIDVFIDFASDKN